MSPKLPVISGADLIRALGKFGYVTVRQKGGHVRLRHSTDSKRLPVTVPLHAEIAFGTLAAFFAMPPSTLKNSCRYSNCL